MIRCLTGWDIIFKLFSCLWDATQQMFHFVFFRSTGRTQCHCHRNRWNRNNCFLGKHQYSCWSVDSESFSWREKSIRGGQHKKFVRGLFSHQFNLITYALFKSPITSADQELWVRLCKCSLIASSMKRSPFCLSLIWLIGTATSDVIAFHCSFALTLSGYPNFYFAEWRRRRWHSPIHLQATTTGDSISSGSYRARNRKLWCLWQS